MTPITFETLSELEKITLYSDNDILCIAYINKISFDDKKRSLLLLIESISVVLGFSIMAIASGLGTYSVYGTILQALWMFLFVAVCGLFTLDVLSLYPIIRDSKELVNLISNGYKIEVFTFDEIKNNCEKAEIFVGEDGFYNKRYDSVIREIFAHADSIYNKDEVLRIEMED